MNKKYLIALCLPLLFAGCLQTGVGTHIGVVTAVEYDGVFWKTYTIWFKSDAASTQEETYCVEPDDHNLANELAQYARTKTPVEISFANEAFIAPSRCMAGAGDTMITSVQRAS